MTRLLKECYLIPTRKILDRRANVLRPALEKLRGVNAQSTGGSNPDL